MQLLFHLRDTIWFLAMMGHMSHSFMVLN